MLQMPSSALKTEAAGPSKLLVPIALPISTTKLFLLVTIRGTEELHKESNRDAEQLRSEDSWYLIQ
jgi:hypothetical protein